MADEKELEALEAEALAADATEDVVVEAPTVDPALEADARRLGWKPEADWKGDKTGWVDASTFMEQVRTVPGKVKRLEADFSERLQRMERLHAETRAREAEAHKAEIARLKAEMRKAVEVGDTEAYDKLEARRDTLAQEAAKEAPKEVKAELPSETQEWKARNTWFDENPEMRTAALSLAQKAAEAGLSVKAQLAYVDREIAGLFPEVAPKSRKPLHSAVDGGSFAAPKRNSKGADALPAEARAAGAGFVKEGLYKSLDEYAAVYFG